MRSANRPCVDTDVEIEDGEMVCYNCTHYRITERYAPDEFYGKINVRGDCEQPDRTLEGIPGQFVCRWWEGKEKK